MLAHRDRLNFFMHPSMTSRQPPNRIPCMGIILLVSALAIACSDTPTMIPSDYFREAPSGPRLSEVVLPSTVQEILERRTHAIQKEFGAEEQVDLALVRYVVGRRPSSEPVSVSEVVDGVSATWQFGDSSAAGAYWQRTTDALRKTHGEPHCYVGRFAIEAYWYVPTGLVRLQFRPPEDTTRRADASRWPHEVLMIVSLDTTISALMSQYAVPICPVLQTPSGK